MLIRSAMPQFVIEREVPGIQNLSARPRYPRPLAEIVGSARWHGPPGPVAPQSYVTDNKLYCVYLAPDEAAVRGARQAKAAFRPIAWRLFRRLIDPVNYQ